ncbi:MAG TPA: hypothetical protein VE078_14370 [Thermoanaerobaculia bacterium]|nr:hypothetical protein [Thermoanaerobaculia bacterium]
MLLGLAPRARGAEDAPRRRRRAAPGGGRHALGVGSVPLGAGHGQREAGGHALGVGEPWRGLDDGERKRADRRLELGASVLEAEGELLELANQQLELE